MHMKNLILLICLFFIFSCSKNIREIERAWKKSCINEYKHTEGSLDYKNCMIIQEENFLELNLLTPKLVFIGNQQ